MSLTPVLDNTRGLCTGKCKSQGGEVPAPCRRKWSGVVVVVVGLGGLIPGNTVPIRALAEPTEHKGPGSLSAWAILIAHLDLN